MSPAPSVLATPSIASASRSVDAGTVPAGFVHSPWPASASGFVVKDFLDPHFAQQECQEQVREILQWRAKFATWGKRLNQNHHFDRIPRFSCYFTRSRNALPSGRYFVRPKIARHLHLKDRLTRLTTEENNLTSMLRRNAICKGKPQASTFLFSLAHERFKEAGANLFRNAGAIVDHI